MINKVFLLGVVKSNPTMRGVALTFRVTTWRNHHDGRRFDCTHSIEVFGKGISTAEDLREGDMVAIEGSVKHSSYEKNGQRVWTTSINAFSVSRPEGAVSETQGAEVRQGTGVRHGAAPSEYPPNKSGEDKTTNNTSDCGF